jgi:hypothetical protein
VCRLLPDDLARDDLAERDLRRIRKGSLQLIVSHPVGCDATTSPTTPGPGLPSIILPDPKITPGRLNPGVRQSTIKTTICKSGWTKTIRPPVGYTNALKIQQMVLYGEMGTPSDYEEDHFIPLELGGAPKNPKNLWPEPHSQSKLSDPLETQLKRNVCKGLMKLAKARAAIRIFKNTQG